MSCLEYVCKYSNVTFSIKIPRIIKSIENVIIQRRYITQLSNHFYVNTTRTVQFACTFINFEKKFPPAQPYFGLHIY